MLERNVYWIVKASWFTLKTKGNCYNCFWYTLVWTLLAIFFSKAGILPSRHPYIFKLYRLLYIRSKNKYKFKDKDCGLRKSYNVVPRSKLTAHQQFYSSSVPCYFNLLMAYVSLRHTRGEFMKALKTRLLLVSNIEEIF